MMHFLGETSRMPASNCTACGRSMTGATPVDSRTATPSPGDFSVCIQCGHIMAFAPDLTLRDLTGAEMHEIAGDRQIIALQWARAAAAAERKR